MTSNGGRGSIDVIPTSADEPIQLVIHPPTVLTRAIARRFKLSTQDAEIVARGALEQQSELVAKHDYIDLLNAARVVVDSANEPRGIFFLCQLVADSFAEVTAALAEIHRQTSSPTGAA